MYHCSWHSHSKVYYQKTYNSKVEQVVSIFIFDLLESVYNSYARATPSWVSIHNYKMIENKLFQFMAANHRSVVPQNSCSEKLQNPIKTCLHSLFNHFTPLVFFYTPSKHQKISDFPMYLEDIKKTSGMISVYKKQLCSFTKQDLSHKLFGVLWNFSEELYLTLLLCGCFLKADEKSFSLLLWKNKTNTPFRSIFSIILLVILYQKLY